MRLANVQVAVRLIEGTQTQGHLPAARATAELTGKNNILISTDSGSSQFEYDVCMEAPQDELFAAKLEVTKTLRQLLHGISVGVLCMGIESEKAGSFCTLLLHYLSTLQTLVTEQDDVNVSLSYMIFGVSDASCIDLTTYQRKELDDLAELQDWAPLVEIETLQPVIESVQQGYSLPCVVLIRLFIRPNDSSLPGAMSTLLLADLGSASSGSPLEKSFAQFRSTILTIDQHVLDQEVIWQPSFLNSFLECCFGRDVLTTVIADVPTSSIARNMQSFHQLMTAMRHIKNYPAPKLETPEMRELDSLVKVHGRLEVEHRAVRRELKQLQKALKVTEARQLELLTDRENSQILTESEKFQFEYQMSKLNMEKIQVHERIRQCEIDLVCMEHERLLLLAQMSVKKRELAELEERLRSSIEEKDKIKQEFNEEITGMTNRLNVAQRKLESTEKEKGVLRSNLSDATAKIVKLEIQITEIEKARSRAKEAEKEDLKSLRKELLKTKESEDVLQKKIANLCKVSDSHQSSVRDLETKLSSLKLENTALQAKLDILSLKPQSPEISRTIKVMEDKWQKEREAMHVIMNDLRSLIKDKEPATNPTTAVAVVKKAKVNNDKEVKAATKGKPKRGGLFTTSDDSESEKEQEEEKKVAVKPPTTKRGAIQVKKTNATTLIETLTVPQSENVAPTQTITSTKPKGRPRGTTTKVIPPLITVVENMTDEQPLTAEPKPAIKMRKSKSKIAATIPPVKANENPITKILGDEDDEEIPGTPQKIATITNTNPTASPNNKSWKPSTFIPGVSRKVTTTVPEGNSSSFLLPGLSFAQGDDGFRKRIKLPDRVKHTATTTDSTTLAISRRNVDPTVYSTILTSFDVSKTAKK